MDETTVPEFKEAIELSNERIEDRNELVEGLFSTVKGMLKNKMRDEQVQTDVACWNGAITYDYEKSTQKSDRDDEPTGEQAEITFEDKLATLMKKKRFDPNEDTQSQGSFANRIQEVDEGGESKVGEGVVENAGPAICYKCKGSMVPFSNTISPPNGASNMLSPRNAGSSIVSPRSSQNKTNKPMAAPLVEGFIPAGPLDMPIQHHTSAMRQIGVIQPNRLLQLH